MRLIGTRPRNMCFFDKPTLAAVPEALPVLCDESDAHNMSPREWRALTWKKRDAMSWARKMKEQEKEPND